MKKLMQLLFRFLGSNGLAAILLIMLFLLTLLGTWEQTNTGLYEVQKRYFESMFFPLSDSIPIPIPGAYLVLMLLAVNLVVGGVYRVKWRPAKLGILIAHLGIAFLLVSGFFTMKLAQHGQVTLYEGETAGEFISHYDWELAVYEVPKVTGAKPEGVEITEHLVSSHDLEEMGEDSFPGKSKTFTLESLPFSLELSDYMKNSWPKLARGSAASLPGAVDGVVLEERPLDATAEANVRGARLKVTEKNSKKVTETLLWGRQRYPFTIDVDGTRWAIDLRKVHKAMPFAVRLNEFIHERHPRTNMPKVFMSKVTKIENDVEQGVKISMNEPLRHKGYTLYQSSWGPQDAGPNQKLFSVFAVVRNPADQLPMWATFVICAGILWQALYRLIRYLRAEAGRRS